MKWYDKNVIFTRERSHFQYTTTDGVLLLCIYCILAHARDLVPTASGLGVLFAPLCRGQGS
jgi:hypothetical protein